MERLEMIRRESKAKRPNELMIRYPSDFRYLRAFGLREVDAMHEKPGDETDSSRPIV